MDKLGKIFVVLLFAVVPSTVLVWLGWTLTGIIPAALKDAILTIVPYGVAGIAWTALAWLGVMLCVTVIDP